MDFGVVGVRRSRRAGLRRAVAASIAGVLALSGAAAVLLSVSKLGAWAQSAPAYTLSGYSSSGLPSFRLSIQQTLIAPDNADVGTFYGSPTSPTASAPSERITALARALENNPDRIYQFVYNTIQFEPQFGLHKGADGVLLDGSGGSFDQSQLMVELLRASGYQARYVLGRVNLPGTDAKTILRVDNAKQACLLLAAAGTPATVNGAVDCSNMSGDVSTVTMLHVWVETNISGTWYAFDPSLKTNTKVAGIDLWDAAGANAASAWSNISSGVSVSGGNLNGLNATSIATKLNTYTDTLQDELIENHSAKSLKQLAGGWEIQRTEATPRVTATPYQASVSTRWAEDIPAPYRATLTVAASDGTSGFLHTYDLAQIYGWRTQAQIQGNRLVVAVRKIDHLDSRPQAYFVWKPNGRTGACEGTPIDGVICGADMGTNRRIDLTINHPYVARRTGLGPDNNPWPLGTFADETVSKYLELGKRADILVRTAGGNGGRTAAWSSGMDPIQQHRFIPAGNPYTCVNDPDTSPQVESCDGTQATDWRYWAQERPADAPGGGGNGALFPRGEVAAAEMAANRDTVLNAWTDMFDRTVGVLEPLSGARIFHQHSIGVSLTPSYRQNVLDVDTSVGIAAAGTDQPHHILAALSALSVTEEALALNKAAAERRIFQTDVDHHSAASRMAAAASVKVLTTAGSTTTLPASVSSDTRVQIETYLNKGFTVAVSADANANAFLARRADGSEQAWILRSQQTSGTGDVDPRVYFLKGADSEAPNPIDYLGKTEARQIAANVAGTHMGAVDLRSGTLSFDEGAEITVGQGDFPYSLSFSRSYVSTGPVEGVGALGMGWTHNWESSSGVSSSVDVLFPQAEAVTAAPMLITVLTALQAGRADTLAASAVSGVAADWLQDVTSENIASVNGGGRSARFVRLADGSWRNPAAATEQLSAAYASGAWTFQWTLSDRSVMAFGRVENTFSEPSNGTAFRNGVLKSWTFPTGVVVSLAYSGGNDTNDPMLATVSNNLGATLTFEHLANLTGQQMQTCMTLAGGIAYGGGQREAQQQCYEQSRMGGRLNKVTGGQNQASFGYLGQCEQNTNFCAFQLVTAKRTLRRDREYIYAFPTGAIASGSGAWDYQQVLTEVRDANVAASRAKFDWRAVGGQVAPYVAESFDSLNRKTIYYPSTFTLSSAKDAVGGVVRQAYDEDGRLIASADPLGRTSRAEYDGPGRTIEVKTPYGDTTSFEFDRWGDLRAREQTPTDGCAAGFTPEQIAWWCQTIRIEADYDTLWHKPTAIRLPATAADPNVRQWTLSYNAQGLVDVMTGPVVENGVTGTNANPVWRTWYDAYGRPNRTQDPTGVETSMTYGGGSNPAFCLTEQIQGYQSATGRITTAFSCNAVGDVLTTTVGGATTTAVYDAIRRKTQETGPSGTNIQTKWVYNLNGDLTQLQQWDSAAAVWRTTTTTYSATHKPLTVTDPSGDLTRTCYDLVDRPLVTIDPELRATRTTYNLAGQPTEVQRFQRANTGACSSTTQLPPDVGFTETRWRRFEYNAGGLQSAEIDANGNRTEQVYDGLGRAARTTYADATQAWTAMDERGQIVTTKQPGGSFASLFYDAMGRDFHVREYASGQKSYRWRGRNSRASYDLAGRPVWREVSTQTTASATYDNALARDVRNYSYDDDPLRRLTAEQWRPEGVGGISYTTGYAYEDGRGNRTSITQPGSWTTTYVYDLANRVQTVTFPGASGAQTVTISHDSLSRRTGVDRPGAAADTTYAYDVDNDLLGLTHAFVAGTGPGSTAFTYGHDMAGKVTSIGISQPVFEWAPTLAYARTYGVPDNRNRISSVSDVTESRALTWNPDGELTQEVRTKTGQPPVTWLYQWTYGHRLAGVTNNAAVNPLTATYSYDSDDRRTKTVVNGLLTYTLWSGTDELAQYNASGAVIRRFVPDGTRDGDGNPTMDARLATVTSAGVVYWLHTDHQGSVIATSDSTGKAVATATYSPHGEGEPPAQSPFGYTGREYDAETGLYYYRARYYSPYLGAFLSMDPVGTKDDPNLYMYVGLDPANKTDPTGKQESGGTIYVPSPFPILPPASTDALADVLTRIDQGVRNWWEERDRIQHANEQSDAAVDVLTGGQRGERDRGNHKEVDRSDEDVNPDDVLDEAAETAGVEVQEGNNGVRIINLPDGRRAVQYPVATSTGRPSIVVQNPDAARERDKIQIKIRF